MGTRVPRLASWDTPAPAQTARLCPGHDRVLWPRARDQPRLVGGVGWVQRRHPRQRCCCRRPSHRLSPQTCPPQRLSLATTTEASGALRPRRGRGRLPVLQRPARARHRCRWGNPWTSGPHSRLETTQRGRSLCLLVARSSQRRRSGNSPAHRYTQRPGRPRGAPGKPSRSHTRGGTSQQAPG